MKPEVKNLIDRFVANIPNQKTEEGKALSDKLLADAMALTVTAEEKKEAGTYLLEAMKRRRRPDVDAKAMLGEISDALSLSYIAKQYFSQLDREDVITIGTYWYDDRIKKTNGEFDIALETLDGYEIYEVKYYEKPLPEILMREEIEKATRLEGLSVSNFGMIASSGFEANELPIRQISGKEIYKE